MWSKEVWDAIAFRVGRWVFFCVALALLPIALGALGALTRKAQTFSFEGLLGQGELLLVTAAVIGAALADLLGEHDLRFRTLRLYCGCSAGVVALASATWFADVAAAIQDDSALDRHAVATGSCWLFGAAIVAGLSCLIVIEASKGITPTPPDEPK
jgi:hypothetical protein